MATQLENGHGNCYRAKINSDGRLWTEAATLTDLAVTSREEGESYTFHTAGFINITTTDTETAVFYLKNTSTTKQLEIHDIRTCGDQVQKWVLYFNDTGGTIISNATAAGSGNMNRRSSKTADADVYKGADGVTRSGGTQGPQHINGVGDSTNHLEGALILGRNDSITLTCEVASAADVCVLITAHYSAITEL